MKIFALPLFLLVFAAGCTAPLEDLGSTGIGESDLAYRTNSTFAAQFEELIAGWNSIAALHRIRTEEGFELYIDGRLNISRPSCSGRMAPTFNCTDLLVEYQPLDESEIAVGDVVSFGIDGTRAQAFGEERFEGRRVIYRRIYVHGDNDYIMKRDGVATRTDARIRFPEIRSKVVGFIFDAEQAESQLEPYAEEGRSVADYNALVSRWNSFVTGTYRAGIPGGYDLYYDRRLGVPSLACTGSMRPAMDCNDLVLTYKPAAEQGLRTGDIVSFRIAPNETSGLLGSGDETIFVMHRIARIDFRDGRTVFITRGDNIETNRKLDNIPLDFGRIDSRAVAYFKESFNTTFRG